MGGQTDDDDDDGGIRARCIQH